MVLGGSQGHPMVLRGSQGHPMVLGGSMGHPMVLRGSQGHPMVLRGSQGDYGAPHGSGRVTGAPHGVEGVPGGTIRIQDDAGQQPVVVAPVPNLIEFPRGDGGAFLVLPQRVQLCGVWGGGSGRSGPPP